ncbi:Pentatricopeptide repeat-containing protein [Raphanus sativus]|uniref:Pentatricopeptide repeat-containing protein At1g61870, mitochondrial n=1 Tax=Raphanus sativus TaxID=3726 RepID=A0A6J0K1R6_RAPSA|nr:pentatricopeptide repeat-containing protein At1g61870, mitochondrial [Raphanus sativus]KAJ4867963.1 Pentatricopeptide repeat-containing protein [Raphanus sativus]
MALLSRIRSSASLLRHLNPSPQIRSLSSSSSASSILSPDSKTPLTSKQKSKTALSLLKTEKDPNRILEICRAASLTPDCHIDRLAFSAAVQNLTENKHFSAVTDLLDGSLESRPDLRTERFAAHAIVLYAQADMLDHSLRVFADLERLEIQRTVRSLNALLFACLVARDYKEAKRVYIEFPKMYKIEPDLETYDRMIKVFCESGSASSSYSIVAEMERKRIKPTSATFGLMIAGFYREDKKEDVGKVLAMMKERGVSVGVSTHNIRIQSLCKRKRSGEAKALLDGMLSSGMKPNAVTYGHLIHGFCSEGEFDEAKKLFKSMVNRGCKPDSECYFTLVYYLCKSGDFEAALSVCKESMEKNWVPSFGIMKSLVNGLAKDSKVEEAKELIAQVKDKFTRNVELWNEVEAALPQ